MHITRDHYLMIGRCDDGKLEGLPVQEWDECIRIIVDDDYPHMIWEAVYDSYEKIPELKLIEGAQLDVCVADYRRERAADERHERSLGRTG